MTIQQTDTSLDYARILDQQDSLHSYRDLFHFPKDSNGQELIYMCGNSLGLQPKASKEVVDREMDRWRDLAVEGHFMGDTAWTKIHKRYATSMAAIVG
ncbi:MAG TPA: kynureninase, partial [Saprospiraceae bacterium]|nr:kynureninase [Saprospiraceae bacterium]